MEAELVTEHRKSSKIAQECSKLTEQIASLEKAKCDVEALTVRLGTDLEKAILAAPSRLEQNRNDVLEKRLDPATLELILGPSSTTAFLKIIYYFQPESMPLGMDLLLFFSLFLCFPVFFNYYYT